jgi:hypothetical protein
MSARIGGTGVVIGTVGVSNFRGLPHFECVGKGYHDGGAGGSSGRKDEAYELACLAMPCQYSVVSGVQCPHHSGVVRLRCVQGCGLASR